MGKGPATRCSPLCPDPRSGSRRGTHWPAYKQGKLRTVCLICHKVSFGLSFVWSLNLDLFAIGGPTRVIKPPTTDHMMIRTFVSFVKNFNSLNHYSLLSEASFTYIALNSSFFPYVFSITGFFRAALQLWYSHLSFSGCSEKALQKYPSVTCYNLVWPVHHPWSQPTFIQIKERYCWHFMCILPVYGYQYTFCHLGKESSLQILSLPLCFHRISCCMSSLKWSTVWQGRWNCNSTGTLWELMLSIGFSQFSSKPPPLRPLRYNLWFHSSRLSST